MGGVRSRRKERQNPLHFNPAQSHTGSVPSSGETFMPTAFAGPTRKTAVRLSFSCAPFRKNNDKSQSITLYHNKITITLDGFSSQPTESQDPAAIPNEIHPAKIPYRYFRDRNQRLSRDNHAHLLSRSNVLTMNSRLPNLSFIVGDEQNNRVALGGKEELAKTSLDPQYLRLTARSCGSHGRSSPWCFLSPSTSMVSLDRR
jgi:hypothetical protein